MRAKGWTISFASSRCVALLPVRRGISRGASPGVSMLRGKSIPLQGKLNHVDKGRYHSYRKLSTGSSLAARAAGIVPNSTPTIPETTIATIAERPDTGTR